LALEGQFESVHLGPPGGYVADGGVDFHIDRILSKMSEHW
jgi:hypothetical protein